VNSGFFPIQKNNDDRELILKQKKLKINSTKFFQERSFSDIGIFLSEKKATPIIVWEVALTLFSGLLL